MTARKRRRTHKIAHRPFTEPHSATLTPEYQAEVDRTMERGRLAWEHQEAEVAKAERRRARVAARVPRTAKEAKHQKRRLRELDELIELERQRLIRLAGLMRSSPQASVHRGKRSFRPVPDQAELL